MIECIFCKIIAKQIPASVVYEDDELIAFKDIHPKAPVHLLVVSKEHIPSLAHVTPMHAQLMAQMLLILPKIAQNQGLEEGFRTIINTGPAGGQEIDHIHFHLLGGRRDSSPPLF